MISMNGGQQMEIVTYNLRVEICSDMVRMMVGSRTRLSHTN